MINSITERQIDLDRIGPITGHIQYVENQRETDENRFINHVHDECEIYIHIGGNVSFIVEDHLYPISQGSIIVTRPYEAHHCIYHDDSVHRHYIIRFLPDGWTDFLQNMFDRKAGTGNHLSLPKEKEFVLFSLCEHMISEQTGSLSAYIRFLRILELLTDGIVRDDKQIHATPSTLKALEYINENITERISISLLAEKCMTSVSALERNFKKDVGVTPSKYILERRLSLSLSYLNGTNSILEVCEKSGFSDYSYYIACFKKRFHETPFQYMRKKFERPVQ